MRRKQTWLNKESLLGKDDWKETPHKDLQWFKCLRKCQVIGISLSSETSCSSAKCCEIIIEILRFIQGPPRATVQNSRRLQKLKVNDQVQIKYQIKFHAMYVLHIFLLKNWLIVKLFDVELRLYFSNTSRSDHKKTGWEYSLKKRHLSCFRKFQMSFLSIPLVF